MLRSIEVTNQEVPANELQTVIKDRDGDSSIESIAPSHTSVSEHETHYVGEAIAPGTHPGQRQTTVHYKCKEKTN